MRCRGRRRPSAQAAEVSTVPSRTYSAASLPSAAPIASGHSASRQLASHSLPPPPHRGGTGSEPRSRGAVVCPLAQTESSIIRAVMYAGDMGSGVPDSTIAELSAVEEPLSPRSERIQKIELYMAEHTYYDLREALAAVANGFRDPPKPKEAYVPDTEPSKAKSSPHELDARSVQTPRQTSEAPKVSECLASPNEDLAQSKESTEEIIQNGKRWMSEEVMLAFEKYIEGRDEFKEMVYGLDELQYQCFSVETYRKIFHHYNFTVKMKKPTSDDWSSTLYFAEVKEMYGVKFYFCCALEPSDDGYCHACKNQGMDALRHPADHVGFEIGQADMECPFFYMSDSDDDMVPIHYDGLAFERAFCRYVE